MTRAEQIAICILAGQSLEVRSLRNMFAPPNYLESSELVLPHREARAELHEAARR